MIKLIILDIDGVVLGTKTDVNFPFPSKRVAEYLTELQDSGMPISLCTGKPSFAVKRIIQIMNLDNPHITDGGAVIFDPIDNKLIKNKALPKDAVIKLMVENNDLLDYWQLYTLESKFILEGKFPSMYIEDKRIMPYRKVDDLFLIASNSDLTKIELVCTPETEDHYRNLLANYSEEFSVQWTDSKRLIPNKIIIITAKNADKGNSVLDLCAHYKIQPSDVLAVGDTMMDWQFMKLCGHVGTLANADSTMQEAVKSHGGFVGGHVDQDGLVGVLEQFKDEMSLS